MRRELWPAELRIGQDSPPFLRNLAVTVRCETCESWENRRTYCNRSDDILWVEVISDTLHKFGWQIPEDVEAQVANLRPSQGVEPLVVVARFEKFLHPERTLVTVIGGGQRMSLAYIPILS
jgi:hypothetical protein